VGVGPFRRIPAREQRASSTTARGHPVLRGRVSRRQVAQGYNPWHRLGFPKPFTVTFATGDWLRIVLAMPEWAAYLILFGAGLVAGTLNVIAGGGSLLTLPVLIFLGLPATVANGTNRVAILAQNIGAVWSFNRHRVIEWRWVPLAAIPAVLGAIVGTWAAIRIGDAAFQRVLAGIMVAVVVWTLWDPLGKRDPVEGDVPAAHRVAYAFAFFLVGVYGGFVQAGVGFLILAVTTLIGLDLVRGNALKVLIVLIFTPIALALFALNGKVDWGLGLALAAGNFLGGQVGVHLSVLKGHRWIKRVVLVTVIAFAIKLWLG